RLPATRLRTGTQPGGEHVVQPQTQHGQPRRRQHRRPTPSREEPAQTDAVPADPRVRIPRHQRTSTTLTLTPKDQYLASAVAKIGAPGGRSGDAMYSLT